MPHRRWIAPPPAVGRGSPKATDRRPGVPALDGIRAVAVALVLANHGGIPGFPGGFIGVDIFFVLSGFLITSLLIDELTRSGRIDLGGFWVRRARRLLPALVVMVLVVVAAGVIGRDQFSDEAVAGLRDEAVAAFFWVANWRFVAEQTDYFTQGAAPSPLQHTWSLAVEEQYYLLWPILLVGVALLLAAVARRRGALPKPSTARRAVGAVAVAGVTASAAATVALTSGTALNRVYFGTDTRVQALLVGAAASALLVADWPAVRSGWSLIRRRPVRWMARLLPIAGLAVLGAAVFYGTGDATQFRYGFLTVVALAAAAVIVPVALDQQGPVARALALRPLVWLGAISYSVYLWHWPIFLVLDNERTGLSGAELFAARCLVTLALATASWWLIEQPIRHWRPVGVATHGHQLRLAVAVVATAAVAVLQFVPAGSRLPTDARDISAAALVHDVSSVETARPATVVPAHDPRVRTVSVFGDSIGWAIMRYLPPTPGIAFIDRTTVGCGLARGGPYRAVGETLAQKPECDSWPSRWAQRIGYDRPDVALLVVGRWETTDRMFNGEWTHIGDPAFDAYLAGELTRALDILGSSGARVVVTTEPYNRRAEKPDGSLYPEDRPARVDQWNALVRKVVGARPGVTVADLNRKLGPNGVYTSKVDGIRVRNDGVHPTLEGVRWLTPWLIDAVSR